MRQLPTAQDIRAQYVKSEHMVPMRDGVTLSADVYLPRGGGLFPTILFRTPYESSAERFITWGLWWAARGYAADVIYAIKSHADDLTDCPRVSRLDKALYACDELAGFITACALVRPERLRGLTAKSVQSLLRNRRPPAMAGEARNRSPSSRSCARMASQPTEPR